MATEINDYSAQKRSGCGIHALYNGVFGHPGTRPRRTVSTSSIPFHKMASIITISKLKRGGSCEAVMLDPQHNSTEVNAKVVGKPTLASHTRRASNGTIATSTSSSSDGSNPILSKVPEVQRRHSFSKEGSIFSERSKASSTSALVRVSSGNILLFSQSDSTKKSMIGISNSSKVLGANYVATSNNSTALGNIMKNTYDQQIQKSDYVLSKRIDPKTLKENGNEEFKKGRYTEALAFYDRAIAINPDDSSYRSNKSAALTGLGRLLKAVFECKEAVMIDPFYRKAHHRLATLYIRLGEGEKALYHFKQSGFEAIPSEISKAQVLQSHVNKCLEAKKAKDWSKVLKEVESTISLGADSALQMFLLQTEALLKLHRHEDADNALTRTPTFDVEDCTKFFGPSRNAQLVLIRAQVDMAAGRFDDAMMGADHALRLDASNKDVCLVVKTIRAVSSARSIGNRLFTASKFSMADLAYTEGLEHEPFNSVLLCNRAACRYKLGQFEKVVEDCSAALDLRPSYTKARLRRAEGNAKMSRWEAAVQDYQVLTKESSGDGALGRSLFEAQVQLMIQQGVNHNVTDIKKVGAVVGLSNRGNQHCRDFVVPVK